MSTGSPLFREFIAAASEYQYTRQLPASFAFRVPFDPNDPVDTPRDLDEESDPEVLPSLAKAVLRLREAGIPLDAALGDVQSVE